MPCKKSLNTNQPSTEILLTRRLPITRLGFEKEGRILAFLLG